jgi:antitoxin VapB
MQYTNAIYMENPMKITLSTVFTNNRTQAVRLPAEARLPDDVKKVAVRIRGKDRIISPIENTWDHFFLSGPTVTEDFMNERGVQKNSLRESF